MACKLRYIWRFELYYWDYGIGILIFSLIMAFTFGSIGARGRGFIQDLLQADLKNILFAAFGGFIWNTGTLLIVAGIAIAGMSVASLLERIQDRSQGYKADAYVYVYLLSSWLGTGYSRPVLISRLFKQQS